MHERGQPPPVGFGLLQLGDGLPLDLVEHDDAPVDVGSARVQRRLLREERGELRLGVLERLHVGARRPVLEWHAHEPGVEPGQQACALGRCGRGRGRGRLLRGRRRREQRREPRDDAGRETPCATCATRASEPGHPGCTSHVRIIGTTPGVVDPRLS